MKPDKFFLADPTRLPELTLAAYWAAWDRSTGRPSALPSAADEAAAPRPARRLAALLARAAGAFARALARSRQRRALSTLSDHMLKDAGLTRADFLERTRMPRPRD
ncbi:MAG TPA: DUF1127 domain-containing protein [Candidatus Acidoferrum sp.]|nr:DUF1127 domain-containing protein [Candidatus Acidoferrum sp.]